MPDSKPLGAGILFWGDPGPFPAMGYTIRNGAWLETSGGKKIVVYTGALRDDPGVTFDASQGIVIILIGGSEETYKTSTQDGPVRIIDAQGERLVLKADNGKLFYFDVPSRQFVDSLAAPDPPTITPPPTAGPELESTPTPPSA